MTAWMRRLAPLIVWTAYLLGYAHVSELAGNYAPLVGLVVVGFSGWLWGAAGGLASGVLGYLAVQVRISGLGIAQWQPVQLLQVDQTFAFVAYGGTGLVIGWLRQLERNLRHERAVSRRALVDPLTGALVRSAFEERLRQELVQAEASDGGLALLFVDLDRFKFVNDTFGHDVGDKLLAEVGKVLLGNVRTNDLVGRVGGDEFMVALLGVRDEAAAGHIARSLVRALGAPLTVEERELQVSASIGVSLYPRDGHDTESLLHSADAAMYQVKQGGKNAFHFSTVEVRTRLSRRLELERKLRRALPENQLEIVYQPQIRLGDDSLVGFEALLRWRSPELGMVSPAEFIPVAEEAGLIASIGHWTLRESAMQQREWLRLGLKPVRVAVNVSTLQFHQPAFYDTVKGALADSGVPADLFEIEVTESVLVRDQELAVRTLGRLERLGVRIALDDFGTGYSSLAYLQRLPIRTLKIDRSFVSGLAPAPLTISEEVSGARSSWRNTDRGSFGVDGERPQSPSSSSDITGAGPIVEAICALAHKLGKDIVAEGIETAFQRNFLRRLGVDLAQGYFFARPLRPAQAEELLRRATSEVKTKARRQQRVSEGHRKAPEFSSSARWAALAAATAAEANLGAPALAPVDLTVTSSMQSANQKDAKFDDLLIWE
ncbi:MAG TPA: EAL domain-containing protein [Trueperaceae bacterium]|nr:EAL domain-containing protein [Trueperaceae bacterium]HRP46113.1 EAL domain-containing protein [Trueperaceae bacterium]